MRPQLIALGAICSTTIFKVENIPAAPAKVLANDMRRIVDGMAVSAMLLHGWGRPPDFDCTLFKREGASVCRPDLG